MMDISPTLPLSSFLASAAAYTDCCVDALGSRWSLTPLTGMSLDVSEVVSDRHARGTLLEPELYERRANTIEDLIQLAVDGATPMWQVIQLVSIAIMRGMVLQVDRDRGLEIAVSVGTYHAACSNELRFACIQDPHGNVVTAHHEYDVGDMQWGRPCARAFVEEDWSAFGAAQTFVHLVGTIRACEALRKAGAL